MFISYCFGRCSSPMWIYLILLFFSKNKALASCLSVSIVCLLFHWFFYIFIFFYFIFYIFCVPKMKVYITGFQHYFSFLIYAFKAIHFLPTIPSAMSHRFDMNLGFFFHLKIHQIFTDITLVLYVLLKVSCLIFNNLGIF